ncbi:hypothetical protein HA402_000279 [Bradysia odoriphaga]|nr:hypothetical protein HA402_000279 [Bradysia odoriphaga]
MVIANQVNISNTWTLPQEGFSVFYRFFRDKISWFEADAVCQFHHANLVTVDNGVQFDAARAFLKELDVTEFVWIGLMRPQNTQHFGWTNSKPLDSTSGYWAEPLPAMESPLCAVIDPARDFRWHALRCGGPETAAFLCEMEVPQWAAECTVQAIPSLTIQYMSDSGTVELSRDCGEEGTRHMPCHGKEDRNTILGELTCIDDTDINDNSLKQSSDVLGDIHQKSVELIKAVSSDNKEDNNINGGIGDGAKVESKPDDRLKLNLDDIMMGDQPMPQSEEKVDFKSMAKADKKHKKKADLEEKYLKKINKKKLEKDESDELMMGDQPVSDDTTVEPRPKEVTVSPTLTISTTLSDFTEAIVSSTTILTTTETRLRRETEISGSEGPSTDSSVFTTQSSLPPTSITSSPVQTPNKVDIKPTPKPHISDAHVSTPHHQKETQEVHMSSDHFIPPMLLVRTQFSLSNGHGEHVEGTRRHIDDHEVSTASSNDPIAKIKTSPSIPSTTDETTTADVTTVEVTTAGVTTATIISSTTEGQTSQILEVTTTTKPISESSVTSIDTSTMKQDASTTTVASTTLTQYDQTTKLPTSDIPTEHVIELKKVTESTITPNTEAPRFRQPHAPKHSVETHPKTLSPTTVYSVESSDSTTADVATASPSKQTTENVVTEHLESITTVTVTTSSPVVDTEMTTRNNCSSNLDISNDKPIELSKKDHGTGTKHHHSIHSDHNLNDHLAESTDNDDPCWTDESVGVNLSNSDVEQPYRPNRRRVLIKPETHSYIKKVLG